MPCQCGDLVLHSISANRANDCLGCRSCSPARKQWDLLQPNC